MDHQATRGFHLEKSHESDTSDLPLSENEKCVSFCDCRKGCTRTNCERDFRPHGDLRKYSVRDIEFKLY